MSGPPLLFYVLQSIASGWSVRVTCRSKGRVVKFPDENSSILSWSLNGVHGPLHGQAACCPVSEPETTANIAAFVNINVNRCMFVLTIQSPVKFQNGYSLLCEVFPTYVHPDGRA